MFALAQHVPLFVVGDRAGVGLDGQADGANQYYGENNENYEQYWSFELSIVFIFLSHIRARKAI